FPITVAKARMRIGAVQKIRIHVIGLQVLERTFERLAHLRLEVSMRVIRNAVVMSIERRELRLQEEGLARDTFSLQRFKSLTDEPFRVMLRLIGGIDGGEAGLYRRLDKPGCRLLLPRSAINKRGVHW